MSIITRREFLKGTGFAALALKAGVSVPSLTRSAFARDPRDFHMLVVGDSLIAGQGLREKDKFYTLTREWLEQEYFGGLRAVRMKNKSHSGSNIFLNGRERKAMAAAEKPVDEFYHQEVNFSFPSIRKQTEIAAAEYEREGVRPEDVKLLMVTGGITNITVKAIIDPFSDSDGLRTGITKYCREQMGEFLKGANSLFPNALLTVIGYYPMVSPKSSTGMIYNAVLELYKFPGPLKPLMNNMITKQPFKILHAKMTKRSRIWAEGSDRELAGAVGDINDSLGREAAVFVKSPIDESTCFGTKRTLLWKMAKKGRSEDDIYDIRKGECKSAIESVGNVDLDFKTRFCELSGLGHPNVEGSKAYAEAIKQRVAPFLVDQASGVSDVQYERISAPATKLNLFERNGKE